MNDPIYDARKKWGIDIRKHVAGEYVGPCPWCGGSDRFHLWDEGNYWCRQCNARGWIGDGDDLTDDEKRLRRIEAEQARQARQIAEQEKRLTALEYMAHCTDWRSYHNAMDSQRREYWYTEGIFDEAIRAFSLGYCAQCPTDEKRRPSYTIPVWSGGVLHNIRHRLIGADNGDKYRPHRAGLGAMIFNADSLQNEKGRAIIWEGEKKTIVMGQYLTDCANVGTMGKRVWQSEWSVKFKAVQDVVIALDPDAIDSAYNLAKLLRDAGARCVRVAQFPVKPDDAVTLYDATAQDIEYILMTARKA